MPARIVLDLEEVKALRVGGLTCLAMSKKLGVSKYKVWTFLVKHGIEREKTSKWKDLDHKLILQLYADRLSAEQIAQQLDVTRPTIVKVLKFYDIEIRGPVQYLELQDENWLRREYENQSTAEIAKKLGCTQSVVMASFKKFGIPLRSRSAADKLTYLKGRIATNKGKLRPEVSGIFNHNWMGGVTKSPYPKVFSADLRREIRKRDGQMCQICCIRQEACKVRLSVHHIDYDKHNNAPENLVALCIPCHIKTNKNRKKWKAHFAEYWQIRQAWENFDPCALESAA